MLQITENVQGIESWNHNILAFDLESLEGDCSEEKIQEVLCAFDPYEPGSCGQFSCSGFWGAF